MDRKCFKYYKLKFIFYLFLFSFFANACKSVKNSEITEDLTQLEFAQYYLFSQANQNLTDINANQNIGACKDLPVLSNTKTGAKFRAEKNIVKANIAKNNPIPFNLQKTHQIKILPHKTKAISNFQPINKAVSIKHLTVTSIKDIITNSAKSYLPYRVPVTGNNKSSKRQTYLYIIIAAALLGGLLVFFGYGLVYNSLFTIGIFLLLAIIFDLFAAIPYWTEYKKLLRKHYGRIAIIALIAGIILMAFLYLVIVIDLSFLGLILIVLLSFLLAVAAVLFAAAGLAWLIMTIVENTNAAQ